MDNNTTIRLEIFESSATNFEQEPLVELHDLQLALVGGGIGDTTR